MTPYLWLNITIAATAFGLAALAAAWVDKRFGEDKRK